MADAPPSRSTSFPSEDPSSSMSEDDDDDDDDDDGASSSLLSSAESPGLTTTARGAAACDESRGRPDAITAAAAFHPSLEASAAAATVGSGRGTAVCLRHDGVDRNHDGGDHAGKRRGGEEGENKKKKTRPLQRILDRSIRKRRPPPELEDREDREDEGDDDATEPLVVDVNAPSRFRESYESKNSRNPKNLENINAIIRDQEAALLISRIVETRPAVMFEGTVSETLEEFSPLTCPPSQPAWGWGGSDRLASRDDDGDDDDDDDTGEVVLDGGEDDGGDARPSVGVDVGPAAEEEEEGEEDEGNLLKQAAIDKTRLLGISGGTIAAGPRIAPALDDAAAVRKRVATTKRGRGGGATALALAAEYDVEDAAMNAEDGENDECNNEDERQLSGKRRQRKGGRGGGITASALAEPDDLASLATTAKLALAACVGGGRIAVEKREDAVSQLGKDQDLMSLHEGGKCPRTAALSERVESSFENDDRPRSESTSGITTERRSEAKHEKMGPYAAAQSEGMILSLGNEGPPSESFSGTTAERQSQSEPLLSSPHPEAVAQPAPSSSAKAAATNATNDTTRAINEMILALRHEYDEMGKALMCPICRSTLKEAIILPCVHAFCHACLKDYYNPPRRLQSSKGGRKVASSPPRKPKAECPVCKTANPGKRSGEKCPHLDEIAKAFKMMGRAFSFTPIKYAADIVMTQLDPKDNVGRGDVFDSDEEDEEGVGEEKVKEERKMPARKKISPIHKYEQHLQLAKAVQAAFVEQAESQSLPHTSCREKLENQMKVLRYRQLAKEQEAVVRADEQTLTRKVKRFGGKKHMVAAVTAAFAAEAELGNREDAVSASTSRKMDQLESNQASADAALSKTEFVAMSTSDVNCFSESKKIAAKKGSATDNSIIRSMDADVGRNEIDELKTKSVEDEAKDGSTVGEDVFCTAPDESQTVEYDTAREESQTTWNAPLSTTIASSMRNARHSMGSVATANSSPLVLHDGNTVQKTRHENKSSHGVSFLNTDFVDDPTPRRPGKLPHLLDVGAVSPIEATEITYVKVAPRGDECSGGINNIPSPRFAKQEKSVCQVEKLMPIAEGTIVFVQARTWPGINKPGGVARVTKVHPAAGSGGNSTKYDVLYVLGGKENQVDESFVTSNEAGETFTIEERLEKSMITGSMLTEKKRSMRQRKVAIKPEATSPTIASASFLIYNDEELTNIPEDVLKWAGILPKENKKKGTANLAPCSTSKHGASKSKKRVLKESNIAKSKSTKKQKPSVKDTVKSSDGKHRSETVEAFKDLISFLSKEEIVRLADTRYSQLVSLDKKRSPSETHSTLYAVTSSLTDKESVMLDSLCQMLKNKSVILKVTKDFNPERTQICITTTSQSSDSSMGPLDVVSQSRTLKVMLSALAGIPILTPRWMEACLKEGQLIAPSGVMCVRSLPTKKVSKAGGGVDQNGPNECFGVAKYAAAFHQKGLTSSNHLLSGISVMLCGGSAGSAMIKDLKVLLLHAGASIISSVSTASHLLTNMSKGGPVLGPFVFLCDDSPMNKTCGIPDALLRQAVKLKTEKESVLCVHFNWLFDSISCASLVKADAYEPPAWKLAMKSLCANVNN